MFINDNIGALNALRNLTSTQSSMGMSLKRLSSGLRINSAADDAAGLAISQKMQAQVAGMQGAEQNAQNAQSMLQIAEGALGQSQNILQRMRQLSVQAAADTSTTADRGQMQTEMNQLAQELTRISNTTQYNTKNLLDGTLSNATIQIGANAGQNLSFQIGAMDSASLGVVGNNLSIGTLTNSSVGTTNINAISNVGSGFGAAASTNTYKIVVGAVTNSSQTISQSTGASITASVGAPSSYTGSTDATFVIKVANVVGGNITSVQISSDGGNTFGATTGFSSGSAITLGNGAATTITQNAGGGAAVGDTFTVTAKAANTTLALQDNAGNGIGSPVTFKFSQTATSLTYTGLGDASSGRTLNLTWTAAIAAAGGTATQQITTTAAGSAANGTPGGATASAGLDLTSQVAANSAISSIDAAISTVSTQRANLGAYENRLQYTVDNLALTSQNLTDARSRITDADMAKEMSDFTKSQILQQAGVSMLAQANSMPQALLKLLQ